MFLKCTICRNEIQADDALIGEFVNCPFCQCTIAVPDPFPPIGSAKNGYVIEAVLSSTLLFNSYKALSPPNSAYPSTTTFLRIPSFFFLKRSADLNAFATAVINSGSMNIPGTPRLLEYSMNPGGIFFAFEFIEATSLEELIGQTGPLPPLEALSIIKNCAWTLHNAWTGFGIVHQNLTPDAIRISPERNVTIFDIGVSQTLRLDMKLLEAGFSIWSPRYMSPEFALTGEGLSPGNDIFSLGMILYFTLTGRTPNDSVPLENIPRAAPPDLGGILPPTYNDLISLYGRMVAPDPANRISSWEELLSGIDMIFNNPLHSTDLAALQSSSMEQNQNQAPPAPPRNELEDSADRLIANVSKTGSRTEKKRKLQSLKRKNLEKGFFERNMGLVLTCFAMFVIAVPLIAFLAHKHKRIEKKTRPATRNQSTLAGAGNDAGTRIQPPNKDNKPSLSPRVIATTAENTDSQRSGLPRTATPPSEKNDRDVVESPKPSDKKKTLTQRVLDVNRFLKENPSQIKEALKRYESISEEARALKRLDIVDLIQEIKIKLPDEPVEPSDANTAESTPQTTDAIPSATSSPSDSVMRDIRRKVDKLLLRKDYENAVWFVEEYSGAYSEETAAARKALVDKIKEIWKNDPNPTKKFDESPPDTTGALNDSDASDTNNAEKKRANKFLDSLSKLLAENSIDFDPSSPEKLLIKLIKIKLRRRKAKKLAVQLQSLVDQADESDFTTATRDIIDALVGFCKRNAGGSLGFEFRASPPKTVSTSDDLTEILNGAESGDRIRLASGTHTLQSADLSKKDITVDAEEGAVVEGGDLSVSGKNCVLSNIHFKDSNLRFFKSNASSLTNCFLENSRITLVKSNNVKISNTFAASLSLEKSNGLRANHCTFASEDAATPALKIDADSILITNSILYSKGYAVVTERKKTNKKCLVSHSIIFGEKGFCMRETEAGEPGKGDLALKKSKVKLFLKIKNVIFTEPSFQDPWKGDWRLEDGAAGKRGASDKKECGVVWP